MRKFVDVFGGLLSNLPIAWFITWFLIFFFLAYVGLGSLNHFRGSARHQREVMEGSLREAKMPEPQIRAISESLFGLVTDVNMLVTTTFVISAAFIAGAYSGGPDRSSRKPRTKIKKRADGVEGSTT